MPTWRTSLGRALTPGKTSAIAQARDLPIAAQPVHAIPGRESLAISPAGDPLPVDLRLSLPWVLKDNFATFRPPGPISILTPSETRTETAAGLSPEVSLDRLAQESPSPDGSDTWAWILPLIEPPVIWSTPAPQLQGNRLRPYQIEGVRQIVTARGILLADDLGLGKTIQACTAIYSLVQRGRARRALVVCSHAGLRHWLAHLQAWAPGLLVSMVEGESSPERNAWAPRAHVYLTDHTTLIAGFPRGGLAESGLSFDIVVLDDLVGARAAGEGLWDGLDQLHAHRRMALSGAPPGSGQNWLSVFDFLFPQPEAGDAEAGLMAAEVQPSPVVILRRTKAEVAAQLPPRTRLDLWVDLQGEQRDAYLRAIAEERRRLAGLGDAVSLAHIQIAVDRLTHAASFGDSPGEGAKATLLVQLLEDIADSGAKAVVVVNDRRQRWEGLAATLGPFGVANLEIAEDEASRIREVGRFRSDLETHVLMGGIDQIVGLGPVPEVSYIIHVDPHWNPAVRLKVEEHLRPETAPGFPLHVYGLWSAATIEARLHAFALERAKFSGGAVAATAELSREDWLERIIEVSKVASASGVPLQWTSDAETASEVLPDKKLVTGMDPSVLMEGVTEFVHALGFPEIEQLFGNSPYGVDLLAWREAEGRIERILVRCLTEEGNVGIADARLALDLLEGHPDISRAYLVGTGDFSAAAKKAAEESQGKLELIAGAELARHLRLLGKLPEERDDPAILA